MKKQLYFLIAFALLISLLFSLSLSASAESAMAGLANPLHAATADSILEAFGVTMTAPTFVSSVSWFTIDGDPGIAEMRFTVDSQNFTYRASPADAFQDISGMYYSWTSTGTADPAPDSPLNGRKPAFSLVEDAQGILLWYDEANSMMYSLSVDSAADAQQLVDTASRIYVPEILSE